MKRRIFLFLTIASIYSFDAAAQTIDSPTGNATPKQATESVAVTADLAYTPPAVEHLLGDPGGIRSWLESHGVFVQLDAIAEFAGNTGGAQQGATSANQIALETDIDWQRLAGLTGFSTHVIFVNRSGASDSHLFGDNLTPVQEIYGAGGAVGVHLVSAYAQQVLLDGRFDIAGGWMNVENDFASSPLYCNYMNNGLCGDPKALPGGDLGHSAYPDAVWGGRGHLRVTPDVYVTVGVYEVNKGLYSDVDRTGFEFGVPQEQGVYVPVQAGYEPRLGNDHLPGHYVVGFGYDSSKFTRFSSALAVSNGAVATTRSGNSQFWLLTDQMLVRNGDGDQDGLIALAGFIANNPDNSAYAQQYFLGALERGFWHARPQDTIGLLFSYFAMSGALGKVQAEEIGLGLPVSNSATGIQTHEMFLEANYNIHVFRGIDFRPEFQYVFRPNAQSDIHNAAVFGFKAHVQF